MQECYQSQTFQAATIIVAATVPQPEAKGCRKLVLCCQVRVRLCQRWSQVKPHESNAALTPAPAVTAK
jgi:hypothetical protein